MNGQTLLLFVCASSNRPLSTMSSCLPRALYSLKYLSPPTVPILCCEEKFVSFRFVSGYSCDGLQEFPLNAERGAKQEANPGDAKARNLRHGSIERTFILGPAVGMEPKPHEEYNGVNDRRVVCTSQARRLQQQRLTYRIWRQVYSNSHLGEHVASAPCLEGLA